MLGIGSPLEPWHELPDKVVMVTGASSGLGREFCLDLAKAGCFIVAAARRTDRLQSLCQEINGVDVKPGRIRAVAVELDVASDGPTIERSVQKAWDTFGRIDTLINNAGYRGLVKTSLDLSEEEWDRTIRTNTRGTWLVSKYVCRRMRDSKIRGSVINISSIDGLYRGHTPGGLAYCCSKIAMNSMTKVMALELGAYKIRVNSIAPGLFKSEITESLLKHEWVSDVALKIVPLQKIGVTNPELTTLVRYLIHDSSEYVTGNIFIAEGGAGLAGVPIYSSL